MLLVTGYFRLCWECDNMSYWHFLGWLKTCTATSFLRNAIPVCHGADMSHSACKCSNIESNRDYAQTDQGHGEHPWFLRNFVYWLRKKISAITLLRGARFWTQNATETVCLPGYAQTRCRNTAVLRSCGPKWIYGGGRKTLGERRDIKKEEKMTKGEDRNKREGKGKEWFHASTSFSHFQSCVCARD